MRPRASTFSIAYDKLSVGEPDSPVIALAVSHLGKVELRLRYDRYIYGLGMSSLFDSLPKVCY